ELAVGQRRLPGRGVRVSNGPAFLVCAALAASDDRNGFHEEPVMVDWSVVAEVGNRQAFAAAHGGGMGDDAGECITCRFPGVHGWPGAVHDGSDKVIDEELVGAEVPVG